MSETQVADAVPAGEAEKRYYVVDRGKTDEGTHFALVEGIPDPNASDKPDKDTRDGRVIHEETGGDFWTSINLQGFTWVDRNFKRFWVYEPVLAAKVRDTTR